MRRTPATAVVLFALAALVVSIGVTGPPATGSGPSTPVVAPAAAVAKKKPSTSWQSNYVPASGAYFSFPNRGKAAKMAIRNRVLYTIKSTKGGRRTSIGTPMPGNGKIRIATWTFDDWGIARALLAARNRGVSVQVVAAQAPNKDHRSWRWLRKHLGSKLYRPGYPTSQDTVSFARTCRGACRGLAGTAHAKYFLFDKVAEPGFRNITFQTSMNLTRFAYTNQWNHAQVMRDKRVYDDYSWVFAQARAGRPVRNPYRVVRISSSVADYFFPRPRARASQDPVMQILGAAGCTNAGYGGTRNHRTRIRIIQYAMYGDRGVWIAKRLRALWRAGCDIKIIYGVTSRPVLQILRNHAGRGAVPMRQSVTKDASGEIIKYNHSKWMTITGRWNGSAGQFVTFTGSANWSLLAFADDEQMQRLRSRTQATLYMRAFAKTWKQRTSKLPPGGRFASFGRTMSLPGVPEDEPTWGKGVYRYMAP
jgi:hypothetical protein